MTALFCQLFFTRLLTASSSATSLNTKKKDPDSQTRALFSKLVSQQGKEGLCEGIVFFLTQYVVPVKKDGSTRMGISIDDLGLGLGNDEKETLKRRIQLISRIVENDK
jgi:hypothetical protein